MTVLNNSNLKYFNHGTYLNRFVIDGQCFRVYKTYFVDEVNFV